MRTTLFLALTLLVVLFITEESTGVGRGCATNSCWWHNQFEGGACRTSTTGTVGRTQLHRTYKCIFGKQKHFCCDPDCGYQACGSTCASLGMNSNWENVMPPRYCTIPPGISAVQHFCCGI